MITGLIVLTILMTYGFISLSRRLRAHESIMLTALNAIRILYLAAGYRPLGPSAEEPPVPEENPEDFDDLDDPEDVDDYN